ncbi:MAG: hypothetical protein QOG53_295 [Frankiales bacterium]|jgi:hypothetical protein|nr:hypothetical protein [Frankiales bacterium]
MAAAIPHLVGFRPEESLVVISLRGPRKRIGLTMRFDLPAVSCDEDFAGVVAVRLAADGATHALVACCTALEGDAAELPRAALIECIGHAVRGQGIAVMDALLIRDGRWWSYLCEDVTCCPVDGTPVEEATDVAAAHALIGRSMLPTRKALIESIRPVEFLARATMQQALDRAGDDVAERVVRGELESVRAETVALVATLANRYAEPATAQLSDDEAARVIVGLFDLLARDEVLMGSVGRGLDVMRALFTDICRRAIPPDDAPACTVLAGLAYADGNGSLANVALERAYASDPDYSLAEILREALHRQVPPSVLRETWLLASARPTTPDG